MAKDDEFEELVADSNYWKPESIGDTVTGTIVRINVNGDFGTEYTLKTDNGKEIVLPCHTILNRKLKSAKLNDYIVVTLESMKASKNKAKNDAYVYKVLRKK